MALINMDTLFDQLQQYIDMKMDELVPGMKELFDEYNVDIITENIDLIALVGENIADVVIVGDNMYHVINCSQNMSSIIAAPGYAQQAQGSAVVAQAAANSALGYQRTAHDWAQEDVDVPINDGEHPSGYSAYHYAKKVDFVQDLSVKDPVESVPINPDGSTGTPTVVYDPFENRFEFGIPVGATGTGIDLQGEATVVEINAMDPANIATDMAWVMLDNGTITIGTQSTTVVAGEWVVWSDADYFVNIGDLHGKDGVDGTNGDDGIDGDMWYLTTTDPTTGGKDGDLALNTNSNAYFEKQSGVWTLIGTLQGSQGDQGIQGLAATVDAGIATSLPSTDSPTVDNSGDTTNAVFDFGIPQGIQGVKGEDGAPGAGIYPQGEATVAELNALTADPAAGDTWVMLDAGTVTYGTQPVDVLVDEWLGWGAEGYFVNLGQPQGPAGDDGADGSVWYTGTGAPLDTLGVDGDMYLDTVSSDYYQKALGAWGAIVGNLQGIQGTAGNDGAVGAAGELWYLQAGVPDVGVGVNGDLSIDTSTSDYYEKQLDLWVLMGNLQGIQGVAGPEGPSTVSDDADNKAIVSQNDGFIYVGQDSAKVNVADDTMTAPLNVPSGATLAEVPQVQEVVSSTESLGGTGSHRITGMVSCTQTEYDALTPISTVLYIIQGA